MSPEPAAATEHLHRRVVHAKGGLKLGTYKPGSGETPCGLQQMVTHYTTMGTYIVALLPQCGATGMCKHACPTSWRLPI